MASKQTNTHEVIDQAVAEAMTATVQAMAKAGTERSQNMLPRLGIPAMKQPNFNWKAEYKYNELKNFRLELNNIFKSCDTPQTEKLAIIKNG